MSSPHEDTVVAISMVLVALIQTHPNPAGLATCLRLLTGDLQVKAAPSGVALPEGVKEALVAFLVEADAAAARRASPASPG